MEAPMQKTSQKLNTEFWQEHIVRYRRSGQSRRQYCLTENLSYWTFGDWLKKIGTSENGELVKINRPVNHERTDSRICIEIRSCPAITILVAPGFDGEFLRQVITELGIAL
jgi:hypothetical protein